MATRRKPVVSSAGGRLADPGSPPGPTPSMSQAPPSVGPQSEAQGDMNTSIRGMANEQYRNALLRRAQGGASVGAPQQPVGAPPGPPGLGPPGLGGPSQDMQPQGGAPDPAALLQQLLRTRTSRRVLGGAGT